MNELEEQEIIEMAEPGLHDQIVKIVKQNHFNKVLDIAAGQGALTYKLSDSGLNVISADINNKNFQLHDSIEFLHLDLNKNLNLDTKFNAVFAIEIIEHLENPYKLVRDCYNLLEDEGTLIISTPNITNYKSRLSFLLFGRFNSFFPSDRSTSGHINPLPAWELHDILESNGFTIEAMHTTKFHLNVKPLFSLKSLFLKTLFTLGLPLVPVIQNWGFNYGNGLKTGNVVIFQAKRWSNEEIKERLDTLTN